MSIELGIIVKVQNKLRTIRASVQPIHLILSSVDETLMKVKGHSICIKVTPCLPMDYKDTNHFILTHQPSKDNVPIITVPWKQKPPE